MSSVNVPSLAWIGVQRISGTSTFINVDGTEPYLDWHEGEPNDFFGPNSEQCVSMKTIDGVKKMNDAPCNYPDHYSCRIDSYPECSDIETNCDEYKCATSSHNRQFCPKTCGFCDTWKPETIGDISFLQKWNSSNCVDTNIKCGWWASRNECMNNPAGMLKFCPVSCHQCMFS
ncbi:unnamed protein product [Oikopleura dioica]|nr:unnamed protein product [Oikopleura dioica]